MPGAVKTKRAAVEVGSWQYAGLLDGWRAGVRGEWGVCVTKPMVRCGYNGPVIAWLG